MKLKKYNDFIKESFSTSQQYADFLTSKAISSDIFNDSLFDVKQFARVSNYRYLVDTKGHAINTEVDDNEKYKLLYTCQIQYSLVPGKNDFNKILDNLNTIKISIDEMIDRVEEEGLKLEKSEYFTDKTTGHERVTHRFEISFISNEISTEELKKYYTDYLNFQDKEYLKGIQDLRNIYKLDNIDFDRYMDTVDDEEYIQVGVFFDDELYQVATYNTKTKQFTIDMEEIVKSIDDYIFLRNSRP
jgi:hypothetical protein